MLAPLSWGGGGGAGPLAPLFLRLCDFQSKNCVRSINQIPFEMFFEIRYKYKTWPEVKTSTITPPVSFRELCPFIFSVKFMSAQLL